MRIAAISNSRIPSTTANSIQAMKVCDAFVQIGHELQLIVPAEGDPVSWNELSRHYGVKHPFEITWLPSRRAWRRLDFVWHAHTIVRNHQADLVYTWLPQAAVVEVHLGNPVILEMHADVAGLLGAWWLRRLWDGRGNRRLLITTDALKRALEQSTGIQFPNKAVQIAPNGVDLDRYADLPNSEEARKRLNLKTGFTIGFTGHFYAGRGIDLMCELARAFPKLNFLLVGGNPEIVEKWRGQMRALGQTNMTLTGFVENNRLPLYQAAADILLMPYGLSVSSSSGQDIAQVINPMKMFEYMAAGRAIITTDLPSIREVLNESTAVFCQTNNIEAWKTAIQRLVSNAEQRAFLAGNARREVEKYTWIARASRSLQGMEEG